MLKEPCKEKLFQVQLFNLTAKHYTVMYVSYLRGRIGVKMQYDDLAKEHPFDEDIYTSLKLSFITIF